VTLTETDKRLIRAFANQQVGSGTSKHLNSDGTRIDLRGGYRVAHWSDGLLHFDPTYGNVSQTVAKAVARAVAPMDIAAGSQWILPEATRKRIAKRNPRYPTTPRKRTRRDYGDLHDYKTGTYLRKATRGEAMSSLIAAQSDGGVGAFREQVRQRGKMPTERIVYVSGDIAGGLAEFPKGKAKRNPRPELGQFKDFRYTGAVAVAARLGSKARSDGLQRAPAGDRALGTLWHESGEDWTPLADAWRAGWDAPAKRNPANSQSAYYVVDSDGEHLRESRTLAAARRFAQAQANKTGRTVRIQRYGGSSVETISRRSR